MRLSLLIAAVLPALALADSASSSTTTITSTATLTRTITVSEVTSVYATYPTHNSTSTSGPTAVSVYPTVVATGTGASVVSATASPSNTLPANYMGAGNSLNGRWVGGAALVGCVVAAML